MNDVQPIGQVKATSCHGMHSVYKNEVERLLTEHNRAPQTIHVILTKNKNKFDSKIPFPRLKQIQGYKRRRNMQKEGIALDRRFSRTPCDLPYRRAHTS